MRYLSQLKRFIAVIFLSVNLLSANAQLVLNADGPGNTYELINQTLAPGYDVVENPECVHPEFGRHITEAMDSILNQYVFEFHIHVTPDNDRCINFDRQRMEIKTYDKSPDTLKGVSGETVEYRWKFRLPEGFQPSSNFTHLHQIKAVGGDADDPIFTLTARKGSPDKLELGYYASSSGNLAKLTTASLSLFLGNWVEATERISIDNQHGTYSITIRKISDGSTLLTYTNNDLLTIRADNTFIRPKWGIYRSLLNAQDLRDETVRFAGFSIQEIHGTDLGHILSDNPCFEVYIHPGSSTITLRYGLAERTDVRLTLLDISGRTVMTALDIPSQSPGTYLTTHDLSRLSKGLYLVQFRAGHNMMASKIILQ